MTDIPRTKEYLCASDRTVVEGDGMAEPVGPVALPADVFRILQKAGASPHLVAHHRHVHAAAAALLSGLQRHWPSLLIDREVVLYGAALHDIGKTVHPEELHGPGNQHEEAGERLLRDLGVRAEVARIARTHGRWQESDLATEDLLVALADTIWKGRRNDELESVVAARIQAMVGGEIWRAVAVIDEICSGIVANAVSRLTSTSAPDDLV